MRAPIATDDPAWPPEMQAWRRGRFLLHATRAGARRATRRAGLACFVLAAFDCIALVMLVETTRGAGLGSALAVVMLLVATIVPLVAGFRLRAGKGLSWGLGTVLCLISMMLMSFNGGFWFLAILGGMIALLIDGLRGALGLHRARVTNDLGDVFA